MAWRQMTWEYMAGFFDGEGCIVARELTQGRGYPHRRFRLTMAQNDRKVLDRIAEFLEGYGIKSRIMQPRRGHHMLEIDGVVSVYRILLQLEPFLIVKHSQANDAMTRLEELMELAIEGKLGSPRANLTYKALEGVN